MNTGTRIVGLYVIADTQYLDDARLPAAVSEAIIGGARIVQYRDKSHDAEARLVQAREVARLCRQHNVLFLVNDDIELAKQAWASGVHLGREDAAISRAREFLGAGAVIGVSCYNELARAEQAEAQGADYVAFGSFYYSRTKPQAVRANLELLCAAKQKLHIPVVAIGGITPENGVHLLAAGADALAVIESVFGQDDVRGAANRFAKLFTQDKNHS